MKRLPPSGKRRLGARDAGRKSEKGASRATDESGGIDASGAAPGSGPEGKATAPLGAGTDGRRLAEPPPRATYRLQFQKEFTFDHAAAIVPYLARLGVSHVYASPIHKARPGSLHGYDVVDHAAINPELGGEEGFRRFSDALRKQGLGLVLDIVPNHVGIGAENEWWQSVLEWGELSAHALAFDIDWERLGANRKLVVPFLGSRYGVALENGELALSFDPGEGSFSVGHFDERFALCPLSYPIILDRALAALETVAAPDILTISERLRLMREETAADRRLAFPAEARLLKQELSRAVAASATLGQAIERAVSLINGTIGVPESFGTLHRLLEAQSYRLAHWRVAASDINYRRFFDINDLAGLRIEEPQVFEEVHRTVFRLIREGRVNGLRIDHVDGLAEPENYLRSLQRAVGPGFFIVVEKILEFRENLRAWPVAGTTGYDILNLIDAVLIDNDAAPILERIYRETTGVEGSYPSLLRRAKADVLEAGFASELEVLVSDLKRIADSDRRTRDYTTTAIREALREIIARFPVYRSYIGDEEGPLPQDQRLIETSVTSAQRHSALPDRSVHEFISSTLLETIEMASPGGPDVHLMRRFRRRFQQLTGPVMAKGLEDTLFYRYAPLLARNEVGSDPGRLAVTRAEFHAANLARARQWPHTMITTATHDTKRGEDARGRLSALAQLPQPWAETLRLWRAIAAPHLAILDGAEAPDANDQFILLQALLGAWPTEFLNGGFDAQALAAFGARMEAFLLKALREAKTHTSWVNPDEAYEAAATQLLRRLIEPKGRFLRELAPFARRLAFLGMLTGLSRTVLKCTLPGIPDIYQGSELWDLSLVDPDNRRAVDYASLERALAQDEPPERLLARWADGHVKQRVLASMLGDRARTPGLYADGDYHPLDAAGPKQRHVLAFRRSSGREALVAVVSRLLGWIIGADELPTRRAWAGTTLPIPSGRWRDVITGKEFMADGGGFPVGELFAALPVAVLRSGPRAAPN